MASIHTERATTNEPLGDLIRNRRLALGLSQQDVAEGICTRTYVSEIERGDRYPTVPVLAALAQRLQTPLADFTAAYLGSPMSGLSQGLALARRLSDEGALESADAVLAHCKHQLRSEAKPHTYEADLHETEGLIQFNQGRVQEALATFHAALQLRRRQKSRRYLLARALFQYGLCALTSNSHLNDAETALFEAYHTILWVHPAEAAEKTEKVIQLHQRIVQALGYLLLRSHNPHGALHVYRFARERWSAYGILAEPDSDLLLGHALAELGTKHYSEARQILEHLLRIERSPSVLARVHNNLGLLDRIAGNWAEAAHHQQTAWNLFSESGEGKFRSACNELVRCAIHHGDYEGALVWLERALLIHSDTADPSHLMETYLLGSKLARLRGQVRVAVGYLARANEVAGAPPALQQLVLLERAMLAAASQDLPAVSKALVRLEQDFGIVPI